MSRAFSDKEKELIRNRLLEAGRERFARFGIRKTNVEELTRTAGISKGAFYIFYQSKEELYSDVMEAVEAEIQAELLQAVERGGEPTREGFKRFLGTALSVLKTHPFFANTSEEDYQYLLRKLPGDRMQAGIRHDEAFVARLMSAWREKGLRVNYTPAMVASLLRVLVFISLHEKDLDPAVYPQMMDLLIDSVAGRLVQDTEDTEQ